MDPLSIPDRLESTTPTRGVGMHNPPGGDSERRRRQRAHPQPDDAEEAADSLEPEKPHELDELA